MIIFAYMFCPLTKDILKEEMTSCHQIFNIYCVSSIKHSVDAPFYGTIDFQWIYIYIYAKNKFNQLQNTSPKE